MLQILKPFKVRHSDTTTITKYIRKETNPFPQKNILSCPCSRSISSLNNQLAIELISIILID